MMPASFTGLTRADWEAQADRLLDAVRPFASGSFARITLPGAPSWSGGDSDALEGFARTFLLAAFRIAGAQGGPDVASLLERYASGLAAGADPAHPDAWPRIDRDFAQPIVEAASIAVGLHLTRPWLWNRLPARTQRHLVTWLGGVVGRRVPDNNWVLFLAVVEEFLAGVGGPHRHTEIVGGLARLESWHVGGGWYTDGDGRRFDHYNGWALHLYPHLWADLAAGGPRSDLAQEIGAVCRERLRTFVSDYVHLIGADGSPLHQGRSLIYRMAAATPLWAGALYDATPLPPGLTRRAGSGILRFFIDRGAPDQDGLLGPGWLRPHPGTLQSYSGPASPYWAAKGFLGLLLPPDHPVWTAPELPLPVEVSDFVRPLRGPNWLAQGTVADGIVRVHNHGSDGLWPDQDVSDDPHYAHLAYSTATAPRTTGVPDSQVMVRGADGVPQARGRIHPLGVDAGRGIGTAASWHSPAPAVRIESQVHIRGRCEVRVHRVHAPVGARVRETGYNLSGAAGDAMLSDGPWTAYVDERGRCTAIAPLLGYDAAGVDVARDADALGGTSAVPFLEGTQAADVAIYASCVVLSREELGAPPNVAVDPVDLGVTWLT